MGEKRLKAGLLIKVSPGGENIRGGEERQEKKGGTCVVSEVTTTTFSPDAKISKFNGRRYFTQEGGERAYQGRRRNSALSRQKREGVEKEASTLQEARR